MQKSLLTLAGVAIASLALPSDADAAGRESIFHQLNGSSETLQFSRFSSSAFGLPVFDTSTSVFNSTAATPVVVEVVDAPVTTPLAVSRTSFRPPVRSPFRPPPRPSIP